MVHVTHRRHRSRGGTIALRITPIARSSDQITAAPCPTGMPLGSAVRPTPSFGFIRYTEMHDLAAARAFRSHDEPEQEVERGRGDHEEIDRRQAIGVICKECPPRLRWRRWVTRPCISRRRPGRWKSQAFKSSTMDRRWCAPPCRYGAAEHPSAKSSMADLLIDTGGRPGFLRRDFHHPEKPERPLRCQPMTVSGLDDYHGSWTPLVARP